MPLVTPRPATGADFSGAGYDDVTPCVGKDPGESCPAWGVTAALPDGGVVPGRCSPWQCCPPVPGHPGPEYDCAPEDEEPCLVCLPSDWYKPPAQKAGSKMALYAIAGIAAGIAYLYVTKG